MSTPTPTYVRIRLTNGTITYYPSTLGDVRAEDNGIALSFLGTHAFAILILNQYSGPPGKLLKSPFAYDQVLRSTETAPGTTFPWSVAAPVAIPPQDWGDYQFCYVVAMATGQANSPLVVSNDPRVIIGRDVSRTDEEGESSGSGGESPAVQAGAAATRRKQLKRKAPQS